MLKQTKSIMHIHIGMYINEYLCRRASKSFRLLTCSCSLTHIHAHICSYSIRVCSFILILILIFDISTSPLSAACCSRFVFTALRKYSSAFLCIPLFTDTAEAKAKAEANNIHNACNASNYTLYRLTCRLAFFFSLLCGRN